MKSLLPCQCQPTPLGHFHNTNNNDFKPIDSHLILTKSLKPHHPFTTAAPVNNSDTKVSPLMIWPNPCPIIFLAINVNISVGFFHNNNNVGNFWIMSCIPAESDTVPFKNPLVTFAYTKPSLVLTRPVARKRMRWLVPVKKRKACWSFTGKPEPQTVVSLFCDTVVKIHTLFCSHL